MKEPRSGREPMELARVQTMNAAQWLARLERSYESDATDIELRWDRCTGRIVTHEIAPGVAVSLSLASLVLQFDENGQPSPHPIDVDGKSSTEVEAWILIELLHRGIDRDRFSKSLPYQPDDLMSGEEPKYSPQDLADELKALAESFQSATEILAQVRESLDREMTAGADLICWPERMEVGFAIPTFGCDLADGAIKVGFFAGDAEDGRPRFVIRREAPLSTAAPVEAFLLPLADLANLSAGKMRDAILEKVTAVKASAAS